MGSPLVDDYRNAPRSTGQVQFENDWYLLTIEDDEFENLVSGLEMPGGILLTDKPHISIIKNELPSKKTKKWG